MGVLQVLKSVEVLSSVRAELEQGPLALSQVFRLGQKAIAAASELSSRPVPESAVRQPSVERIAVLGNVNIDYLAWAIACGAVLEGAAPIVYRSLYGAFAQEVLDPNSGLHKFQPSVVVIATDWRDFVEKLPPNSPHEVVASHLANRVQLFEQLWDILTERFQCKIIQHLAVEPAPLGRGLAERLNPASPARQVSAINASLMGSGGGRVQWLDMETFAHSIGMRNWASEKLYHTAKVPFDPRYLPDYLPFFRSAWRRAFSAPKKVLAVDLDNTLWGGVIGDSGVDGIVLGPGSVAGEAFAAWGEYLVSLAQRGVVLAICSKNNSEVAATGLQHPHCKLRADDFAAIECSWEDKARGLRRLAAALNVGLDSFVFVDDNPAECALVRQELPEVAVVPLGDDPTQFISLLEEGRWFDVQSYSNEDFGKREAYGAIRSAIEQQRQATDMKSFLRDLRMVGRAEEATPEDLDRLEQLEHKTNQFNLTTRRYAAADISRFMKDGMSVVLTLRLEDRFASHGLISSLVAVQEGDSLRIDSWLMSCRVFSRTAEHLMIQRLARVALQRGLTRIVGEYLPTKKNEVVADLFRRLGFAPVNGDGRFWSRDVTSESFEELDCFIQHDVPAHLGEESVQSALAPR